MSGDRLTKHKQRRNMKSGERRDSVVPPTIQCPATTVVMDPSASASALAQMCLSDGGGGPAPCDLGRASRSMETTPRPTLIREPGGSHGSRMVASLKRYLRTLSLGAVVSKTTNSCDGSNVCLYTYYGGP